MMDYPRPLCVDFFYNRTGRAIQAGDIVFVNGDETDGAIDDLAGIRLRAIDNAFPHEVFRAEVCLPHALKWAEIRNGQKESK